jgi:hypothetical protein
MPVSQRFELAEKRQACHYLRTHGRSARLASVRRIPARAHFACSSFADPVLFIFYLTQKAALPFSYPI